MSNIIVVHGKYSSRWLTRHCGLNFCSICPTLNEQYMFTQDNKMSPTTSYTLPTTESPSFYETLNSELDTLFGIICCICFVTGTCGNLAAFCFFRFSKNNVPHSIYKIITATDLYISLCILPVGICYFMDRSPGALFGSTVPCYIWG